MIVGECNKDLDLAIVKINGNALNSITLGDSDSIKIGQKAFISAGCSLDCSFACCHGVFSIFHGFYGDKGACKHRFLCACRIYSCHMVPQNTIYGAVGKKL